MSHTRETAYVARRQATVLNALYFGRSPDHGVLVLNGYRMQRYDASRDAFGPAVGGGLLNGNAVRG